MTSPPVEPTVYVILPVHNRRETTLQFLRTLKAQSYGKIELILVDDGSRDGTSEAVENLWPQAHIVVGDGELWWGGGVDAGLHFLETLKPRPQDLLLFVNDDTLLPNDFVSVGVSFLEQNAQNILLARASSQADGVLSEAGSKIIWPIFRIVRATSDDEINCAPSRGLMMSFSVYQAIGPWNPQWLPHYCSDYEFTCRAIRKGFRVRTTEAFALKFDIEKTGAEKITANSAQQYFQKLFSMRSIRNPKTLSVFVWHSCPWYFMPFAMVKIWLGACVRFLMFYFSKRAKS